MSDEREDALETALAELEDLATEAEAVVGALQRRGRPDRYDARALLVPLGGLLRGEGQEAAARAIERLREVLPALGPAWEAACRDELALACAEHIHAVDPRYLGLPNYDFAYTRRARERLEDRLVAARALELPIPAPLLEAVERADERLAAHVRKPRS